MFQELQQSQLHLNLRYLPHQLPVFLQMRSLLSTTKNQNNQTTLSPSLIPVFDSSKDPSAEEIDKRVQRQLKRKSGVWHLFRSTITKNLESEFIDNRNSTNSPRSLLNKGSTFWILIFSKPRNSVTFRYWFPHSSNETRLLERSKIYLWRNLSIPRPAKRGNQRLYFF